MNQRSSLVILAIIAVCYPEKISIYKIRSPSGYLTKTIHTGPRLFEFGTVRACKRKVGKVVSQFNNSRP